MSDGAEAFQVSTETQTSLLNPIFCDKKTQPIYTLKSQNRFERNHKKGWGSQNRFEKNHIKGCESQNRFEGNHKKG